MMESVENVCKNGKDTSSWNVLSTIPRQLVFFCLVNFGQWGVLQFHTNALFYHSTMSVGVTVALVVVASLPRQVHPRHYTDARFRHSSTQWNRGWSDRFCWWENLPCCAPLVFLLCSVSWHGSEIERWGLLDNTFSVVFRFRNNASCSSTLLLCDRWYARYFYPIDVDFFGCI